MRRKGWGGGGGSDPKIFDMGDETCFEVETILPCTSFPANFFVSCVSGLSHEMLEMTG